MSGALTWLQAADILGMHPRSLRRWRAALTVAEDLHLDVRARALSPNSSRCATSGPTKVSAASAHIRAKLPRSARLVAGVDGVAAGRRRRRDHRLGFR